MEPPYGWREGQVWDNANAWGDKLSVSKEVMSEFLEKYKDYNGYERVIPTDLGMECIKKTFKFVEDDPRFLISRRGPNDYNIHQTHNGEERLFSLELYADSGSFKPKFFGEDMMRCKQSDTDVSRALIVAKQKGLDPYMSSSVFGKMLGYKAGRKKTPKRRSTRRRKHTLVKRRNVRVNRFRTLKA
jgi:hypothetical protein